MWKSTLFWRSRIWIPSKCAHYHITLDLSISHLRLLSRVKWFFWLFFLSLYYRGQGTSMKPSCLSNIWPWAREFGPEGLNLSWESKALTQSQRRPRCYWKYLQEQVKVSFARNVGNKKNREGTGEEVRPGNSGPPAKCPINQCCSSWKAGLLDNFLCHFFSVDRKWVLILFLVLCYTPLNEYNWVFSI